MLSTSWAPTTLLAKRSTNASLRWSAVWGARCAPSVSSDIRDRSFPSPKALSRSLLSIIRMMTPTRVRCELPRTPLRRTRVDRVADSVPAYPHTRIGARPSSHIGIGQVLMNQPHRHSALPHGGGHTLDRTAAHVARREHSRHARLQQVRLSSESAPGASLKRRTV